MKNPLVVLAIGAALVVLIALFLPPLVGSHATFFIGLMTTVGAVIKAAVEYERGRG